MYLFGRSVSVQPHKLSLSFNLFTRDFAHDIDNVKSYLLMFQEIS
jgi:hypothetical protein